MPWYVLTHHRGPLDGERVLDIQQLHAVHIDDAMESIDGSRVWVGAVGGADPGVRPAQTSSPVLLGHDRVAVGPGVHEYQVHIGDAPPGQRGDHVGMPAQDRVGLFPLVNSEVGLDSGNVVPGQHLTGGQRDKGLVRGVLGGVQTGGQRTSIRPGAVVVECGDLGLGWLGQLHRGVSPARPDIVCLRQNLCDRGEFLCRERIEGVKGIVHHACALMTCLMRV
ncbi:Uncharacterised protein [Mycobacteroides abscessus subsp. massiliense]|nr:Uncharacterised protein [Mycobacteroides abscessus subsp. massiliense]